MKNVDGPLTRNVTVPSGDTVTCTVRFREVDRWFDERKMVCNTIGKKGKDQDVRELVLDSYDAPVTISVSENGNEIYKTNKATRFWFDEAASIRSAVQEAMKTRFPFPALSEGAVKKINDYVISGRSLISSPKEVRILTNTATKRRHLVNWNLNPDTRMVLEKIAQKSICTKEQCQPVLILTLDVQGGRGHREIIPLKCTGDDPNKGCENVTIQITGNKTLDCGVKRLKGSNRVKCVTPPL